MPSCARKKTSTCAVFGAFENPHRPGGASGPVFGSHYEGGLASRGHTIGSQRVLHRFVKRIAVSRTLQRFGRSLPAAQREFTMSDPAMQALGKGSPEHMVGPTRKV